jgi:hypothetical protein
MGRQQKLKQARRQVKPLKVLPFSPTCCACLKPFQEGEQVHRLVISWRRKLLLDLCTSCSDELPDEEEGDFRLQVHRGNFCPSHSPCV